MQAYTDNTLGLRISAVFIILSAALLGGLPPLFVKALRSQDSLPTFLIRAFSAGIILALGLVHILPDAFKELADLGGVDYPLGGTCVLVGLLIMIFIEHGAHIMHNMPQAHANAASLSGVHNHNGQSHSHNQGQSHAHDHSHSHLGPSGAPVGEPFLAIVAEEWSTENANGSLAVEQSGGKPVSATAGCVERSVHACATASEDQSPSQLKDSQQQQQQQQQQQENRWQDEQPTQQQQQSALAKQAPVAAIDAAGPFTRRSAGAAAANASMTAARPLAASSVPVQSNFGTTWCLKGAIAAPVKDKSCTTASASSDSDQVARAASAAVAAAMATPDLAVGSGAGDDTLAAALSRALLRGPSDHCHDCVSRASAPSWASAVELSSETKPTVRQRIVAYLFELGCIFHSFIIGLSLGANRTSISQVRALLIALSFHQALEALSLASVINGGGFSIYKAAAMVIIYSATCPIGVAIGIAIISSYDPDSTRGRAAQGCLNGVSGGMLLYISLVQLVSEDMGKYLIGPPPASDANGGISAGADTDATASHGSGGRCGHNHGDGGSGRGIGYRIRVPSFLVFSLGAASMCLLAVWA